MPKSPHAAIGLSAPSHDIIGYVNGVAYQTIQANSSTPVLFPLRYAENCLETQQRIFAAHGFEAYGLHFQLKRLTDQLSLTRPRGLVFIDYDGTIINSHVPISSDSRHFHAMHYNISQEGWRNALESLRIKGYEIILLTNRVPLIGEDDIVFRRIINQDLSNLLSAKIFVSRVMFKGLLMYYLADKIKLPITNMILVDNDEAQIQDARHYGAQIISFARSQVSLQSRIAAGLLDRFKYPVAAQLARSAGTTQLPVQENDPWIFEQMNALPVVGPPRMVATVPPSPRAHTRARSPDRESPPVMLDRSSPTFFLASPVCTPTYSEMPRPSHPLLVPATPPEPVIEPGVSSVTTILKTFFS